jgi:hypothetical protein
LKNAALLNLIAAILFSFISSSAWADTPPSVSPPDKTIYSFLNPTPADLERSFCTDRPTKSTGPCTVDAGHFQIESDIFNVTLDRSGGQNTNTFLFSNPTLKLGLTNTADIEVNLTPYEQVDVRDRLSGAKTHAEGVGDLYLRGKLSLMGDDGGDIAVTLSPFVKLPTAAHGLGDGAVEEGLLVPMSFNLPQNWALSVVPEIDSLKNAADNGRHLNLSGSIGLSRPVTKSWTLSMELWSDVNIDPRGTVRQYSFDLGAAWTSPRWPNLQLDCGVNFGLNSVTPEAQIYTGISRRF